MREKVEKGETGEKERREKRKQSTKIIELTISVMILRTTSAHKVLERENM